MELLPLEQIREIHATAVSLRLSREVLYGGLDGAFVAALPGQLLAELFEMNRLEELADGTTPLRVWLENALSLSEVVPESEVFRRALARL